MANEMVDGGRPYIDAVERKPPLLFWTYAAIFRATGKFNWVALHFVALAWTLCAMAGLYAIGSGLFDRNTGLIAALFYGVFQHWGTWKNLSLDGEMLMNLPIIWAWAIAFRRSYSRLRPELMAAGALLAGAFLLKQPAPIAAVPLGIYLLLPSYRVSRNLRRTNAIVHATMLTTGFFTVVGLVTIVLWKQGILHEAYTWTVGDHDVPHVFWRKGIINTLFFVGACLPLVIGAIMACQDKYNIWADRRAERTALLGLLAASAIGAVAGARFYPHYYVQLIPPFALLAAPYYAGLWSRRIQPPHWLMRPMVTYAWLALTVIAFSIVHWIGLVPRRVPFKAGRYLIEHSAPETEFSSGVRRPKFIFIPKDVLPLVTSYRFRSLATFSEGRFLVLIRATESFQVRGTTSNRTLPNIRLHISSTFTPTRNIQCNSFQSWQSCWRTITNLSREPGRGNLSPKRLSRFAAPRPEEQSLASAENGSSCRYFSFTTHRSMARHAALRRFDVRQKSL